VTNPPPLYVSFYTPDYKECADRLRASLGALNLPCLIQEMPDQGKWHLNCGLKATFLTYVREYYPHRPLVWVDADAVVHRPPTLFDNLAASGVMDVGVCRWKRLHSQRSAEVLSGTIYLGATPGAGELLKTWDEECRAYPLRWDQVSLSVSIMKCNLKIEWLPVTYVFIHDIHRWEYPEAQPVIEHFQYSRVRKSREIAEGGSA